MPKLIRFSLFLFFAGLLVSFIHVGHPVFGAVLDCMALATGAYIYITLLPIFRPDSARNALSSTVSSLFTGMRYTIFKVLSVFYASHRFDISKMYYHNRPLDGINALNDDDARANFFAAIPGFFNSEQVNNLEEHLPNGFRIKFERTLDGFLDRTASSKLVSESFRSSQLMVCLKATHVVLGRDGVLQILCDILSERWPELLQSVEMALALRRWSNIIGADDDITHYVRRIVTRVVAGVRERDDHWISLAMAEFGVPDHVLRDNLDHGDSALFALLIHITRQAFRTGSWTPFILLSLTQFDVCDTLPELQNEFCALWNEIVHEAWKGDPDSIAVNILREIRHAYIGLHQGTDAAPTAFFPRTNYYDPVLKQPVSYRLCNIANHRPDWTPEDPVANHLAVPPTRADLGSSAASTIQSAPSVADTDTNIARPEDPTPVSSNMVAGETSQAPVAASLPCPHPGPLSTIFDPSTGPVPSSCISIPDSGHDLDVATLRRPPESNTEKNKASPSVESDISEISLMTNPIPRIVPSSGAILQKSEEMIVVPATVVSGSQTSSIPMPVFRSSVVPADSDLSSTMKSTGIQFGHIPHPLGSPSSSSSTTPSHISPRPSSDLDTLVQPSKAVLRAHGRTSKMEPPIPLADLSQLALPSLNIVVSPPQPEDHPHG
jgi:hypothetical protein